MIDRPRFYLWQNHFTQMSNFTKRLAVALAARHCRTFILSENRLMIEPNENYPCLIFTHDPETEETEIKTRPAAILITLKGQPETILLKLERFHNFKDNKTPLKFID